jgi:hypothetical protein
MHVVQSSKIKTIRCLHTRIQLGPIIGITREELKVDTN